MDGISKPNNFARECVVDAQGSDIGKVPEWQQ